MKELLINRTKTMFEDEFNCPNPMETYDWEEISDGTATDSWQGLPLADLDKLVINTEYQRELTPLVKEIAKKFKYILAVGVIVYKPTMEIVDGQQRAAAAILRKLTKIPVVYYSGKMSMKDLAKAFVEANKNTAVQKKHNLWKGDCASGIKEIVAIQKILERNQLTGKLMEGYVLVTNPYKLINTYRDIGGPRFAQVVELYSDICQNEDKFHPTLMEALISIEDTAVSCDIPFETVHNVFTSASVDFSRVDHIAIKREEKIEKMAGRRMGAGKKKIHLWSTVLMDLYNENKSDSDPTLKHM